MKEVRIEEVKKAIDKGDEITIVDVRTVSEFDNGHIPGSINLPLDIFKEGITSSVPDKKTTLYLYCLSGSRSSQAVDMVESLGYRNAYTMKSGLLGWRANKFPLVLD